MEKSIYDQIRNGDALSNIWKDMQGDSPNTPTRKPILESKRSKRVLEESASENGQDFNTIFNNLKSKFEIKGTLEECEDGSCGKKSCGCKKRKHLKENELPMGGGEETFDDVADDYNEDKMVEVPVALIDELSSYIKDAMGSEDETEIDQEEFEQLEESAKKFFTPKSNGKYKKCKVNKYTNTKWKKLTTALGYYKQGNQGKSPSMKGKFINP